MIRTCLGSVGGLSLGMGKFARVLDRGDAAEHAADAQVLIEKRPMDGPLRSPPFPAGPLLGRGTHKARIPFERGADAAPVLQRHGEVFVRDFHGGGESVVLPNAFDLHNSGGRMAPLYGWKGMPAAGDSESAPLKRSICFSSSRTRRRRSGNCCTATH